MNSQPLNDDTLYERYRNERMTEEQMAELTVLANTVDNMPADCTLIKTERLRILLEAAAADSAERRRLFEENESLRATVAEKDAEIERLTEQVYRPLGDNHHNAAKCPYCNPAWQVIQLQLADRDARLVRLRKSDLCRTAAAERELAALRESMPQWCERPTCAGLWATWNGHYFSAMRVTKKNLKLDWKIARFYGPIPDLSGHVDDEYGIFAWSD